MNAAGEMISSSPSCEAAHDDGASRVTAAAAPTFAAVNAYSWCVPSPGAPGASTRATYPPAPANTVTGSSTRTRTVGDVDDAHVGRREAADGDARARRRRERQDVAVRDVRGGVSELEADGPRVVVRGLRGQRQLVVALDDVGDGKRERALFLALERCTCQAGSR